jgi:excisionase family DNA binding protein
MRDASPALPVQGELLTVAEAASLLKLSPRTLDKWRLQPGVGPAFVRVGSAIRYRGSDLKDWLNSRTVSPSLTGAMSEARAG